MTAFNNEACPMGKKSIHKVVLFRLVLAWLFLSMLIGAVVFYLETEKIDRIVLDLALRESADLIGRQSASIENASGEQIAALQAKADALTQHHFSVVEIYDPARKQLVQAMRPESVQVEAELDLRGHKFPLRGEQRHEKFYFEERLYLQVLVPLRGAGGALLGYFEGIYQVDEATLREIKAEVNGTLLLVWLVIFAVSVALYPIIIGLNKNLYKLSLDLLKGNVELMAVLGSAVAKRDSDTNEHNYRVTLYAASLGEAMGVEGAAMRDLIAGAFLHDVGKIGISDTVLLKPDRLNEQEMDRMHEHVSMGVDIVREAGWLRGARDIIEFHHEKYDGSGYMRQLRGEQIPLNARIFAIVDVFDALTSKRPYKEPFTYEHAMQLLRRDSGAHFDPRLLEAFAELAKPLYEKVHAADEATLEEMLNVMLIKHFYARLHRPVSAVFKRRTGSRPRGSA